MIFFLSTLVLKVLTLALVIISEREKQLEMINTSLKDQRKEMQERLDDLADTQLQKREEVSLEQADVSEQIVELQNQMSSSNAEMKNDVQGENMVALLENCKGIEFLFNMDDKIMPLYL